MSGLLLKITERNWGLSGPGSWESTEWKIRTDASYTVKVIYRPISDEAPETVKEYSGVMNPEDYDKLRELGLAFWDAKEISACDGTAWEFTYFVNGGAMMRYRELGYIYGIEAYENMARIVRKYDHRKGDD